MRVSVLQWNVWYQENIEHVLAFLRAHPTDVICLQELTRGYIGQSHKNTWEYVAHALGYHHVAQEIPIITPRAQWSQANAIFSKYPIVDKTVDWLHEPADPEAMDDQYRGYLEATIEESGVSFSVATVHLSFSYASSHDQELARLSAILKDKRHSYVLTGDFNAVPESDRMQAVTKLLKHAGPGYDHNTWTTKPFQHGNFTADSLNWRYDYIFTSGDIKTVSSEVLRTDVSDHLPVLAVLDVPER